MRKVLNDPALQRQFDRDGYVRIPFISKEKAEHLKNLFFETLPQSGGSILPEEVETAKVSEITYDFTFIDKNPEYKKLVLKLISDEFKEQIEKYLNNYKPIIANYIRKKTDGGEVPLHQNWAFVEERKYTSVSIWCPLVDSTRDNGTLEVVPGSHKRFAEFRGPMIPWELEDIKNDIINKYLVPLDTKAGDAVILDDSIVHYTRPNKTPHLRLAIQLILIPAEVPSKHYHINPDNNAEIRVLEVQPDFYMHFNPWMKPENVKVTGTIPYKPRTLTVSQFEAELKKPKFDEEASGLFARLKQVFSKAG